MKNFRCISTSIGLITLLTTVLAFISTTRAMAQPNAQWEFYLAFEDATGTRDTLWLVFDTGGVIFSTTVGDFGLNPELGQIPIGNDSVEVDSFHVWMYQDNLGNHYDVCDGSFSFGIIEVQLYGENFVLPMTMRWDTTLFNSDVFNQYNDSVSVGYAIMDSNYLFTVGGSETGWDMMVTDHVELPYFEMGGGTANHFPIFVHIDIGGGGNPAGVHNLNKANFTLFPNPASEYVTLTFPMVTSAEVLLLNATGKLIWKSNFTGERTRLNLEGLENGLYFIAVVNETGRQVKKVIVSR